jgi:hypothetical protein
MELCFFAISWTVRNTRHVVSNLFLYFSFTIFLTSFTLAWFFLLPLLQNAIRRQILYLWPKCLFTLELPL